MVGGGTGIGLSSYFEKQQDNLYPELSYYKREVSFSKFCMPVFVETELHTPLYKWSIFFNLKFGYNLFFPDNYYEYISEGIIDCELSSGYEKIFFSAAIGASHENFSLGIGYCSTTYFTVFFSYDLPLTSISNTLF